MDARMTQRQEILAAFGCGAVVGGVVAYFVTDRSLRAKYEDIIDSEIAEMREHYREAEQNLLEIQERISKQPKPDIQKMAADLKEVARSEIIAEREGYVEGEAEGETEDHNVFEELPGWNYDREVAGRTADKPFIMHFDEYQQSECSRQITITYFEGDDVLIDETDEVISKKDEVVGMDNLAKFGFGSGDPNVVYVRNPKLDIEYEILRDKGHYAKEILGLEEDPAIEHSAMPKRRLKFDDDG